MCSLITLWINKDIRPVQADKKDLIQSQRMDRLTWNYDERFVDSQGPVVQSIVSLTSLLVIRLVSTAQPTHQ